MYLLNENPGSRPDVVHQEHPWEECNVDQAIDRELIDASRARELVGAGAARFCQHCLAEGIIE